MEEVSEMSTVHFCKVIIAKSRRIILAKEAW